ncbi:hypothetical protein KXR87_06115 [Yokenella regensburgei]|uniref:hypothetical protein n=1 Tax=Yokenella regensburgei TaxID=158877 RepID=UPI003F13CB1B
MCNVDLHDAIITGVKSRNEGNNLIISVKTEAGASYEVIFSNIYDWVLTPFENQNIIFSIEKYTVIPKWVSDEYGLMDNIPSGVFIFVINSSCGMNGFIFSKEMNINKL